MKDFFKKILSLVILSFILVSCSTPKNDTDEDEEANQRFFDVVYITQASKITGQSSWTVVQGDQRFKFLETTEEDSDGSFTVSFSNFREPQLASSVCSGGFTGTFKVDSEDESTVEEEENQVFNPLDPYDSGTEIDDDEDTEDEISAILVYVFSLNVPTGIENRNLTAGCRDIPEDFEMKAVRFESGDVLMTDLSRNIDYYLVPEIIVAEDQ